MDFNAVDDALAKKEMQHILDLTDRNATPLMMTLLTCPLYLESHVKICVLALMIERVAELECSLPWSQIQRELDRLQATEFFDLKNRVLMRNEISFETANILKKLKIQTPKQILEVKNPA